MASLKPFVLNLDDLDFLLDQVTFLPLFDQGGNALVAWDGTGAIYDGRHNLIWNGTGLTPEVAIQTYGQSFASTTDLSGLRDVSGFNNNLLQVNADWGSVDQPFVRTVRANFADYVKPLADPNPGVDNTGIYYGDKAFAVDTDPDLPGIQYAPLSNYTTTVNGSGTVTQSNVVDYTPRMISQTVTTAGAAPVLDANNHIVNWDSARYATDSVYAALIDAVVVDTAVLVEGAAVIGDANYGLLGELGHKDYQKAAGTLGSNEFFIGAENPGVAPTNGWFALFGQFFDHGLDKISSGGQGTTIKIALAADDPLYGVLGSNGQPVTSITIGRATVSGTDVNGDPTYINHTSPFIDQSQTYGSHEQMTQLLRAWVSIDVGATYHAGMELFDGQSLQTAWIRPDGVSTTQTLPTLNELRDHVLDTDRDALTWEDVLNLRNRGADGDLATGAGAGLSGQALLLDMNPRFDSSHLDPATAIGANTVNALVDAAVATLAGAIPGLAFSRSDSGGIQLVVSDGAGGPNLPNGTYTGASALAPWVNFADFSITAPTGAVHDAVGQILLAAVGDHYIAGDGRVNENVGLTAIHHVFHEEHNFQIQNAINTINAQDAAVSPLTHDELHRWQINTGSTDAHGNFIYANAAGTADDVIAWDQDKMFNAAKLIVEMEYQHAAVDQYARSITPHILEVVGYSSGVDSTISLEYSQSAFRFGHSTIRETIDTIDPTHGLTGQIMSFALEQAFLNPALYAQQGAAAIALGMSHQQMNEVDEFITPALNQGLLNQPLDLAAINIARGRDLGIPNLNEFREAVGLTQYTSWDDFGHNMIHPESLVNFIAAYAFDGDVAKAQAIMGLFDGSIVAGTDPAMGYTADQALAFMYNADGAPVGAAAFNLIDTWLGGLAEAHVPGGLLGSTFDLVFTNQIENLINGDRFYYLVRLFGQQFGEEVNNGQFKDIVERNTGLTHLNGSIFAYADQYYDFTADPAAAPSGSHNTDHMYGDVLGANPTLGVWSDGSANPASINGNGAIITFGGTQYIRDFRPDLVPDNLHPVEGTPTSGADSHEVMVGTGNADYLHMRSGDDTAYGEGGDDKLFGDFGNDRLYGGDGADVIDSGDGADLVDGGAGDDVIYGFGSGTEIGGFDQLIGGDGNDIIYGGEGIDKLSGGAGDDALYGEGNTDPFTHGGDGNDYIDGGSSGDNLYGDAGDDFIVGGDDQDIVQGDDGDDILRPGRPSQAINGGPDEVIGGTGYTDTGFDLMDLSDYDKSPTGVTADMTTQQNPLTAIDGTTPFPAWFQIEGVVGTQNNDTIIGDDPVVDPAAPINNVFGHNWLIGGSGNDTFTGAGGNDVIVGGSIRLDALIGKYIQSDGTTPSAYNTYDAYSGATHRIATTDHLSGGLLDNAAIGTGMFDLHYTEFLKTNAFKNHVLGQETTAGSGTAAADTGTDTAEFSGNFADYDIQAVTLGAVTAYKIIDNRADSPDGTDLVVGVEYLRFADQTVSLINSPPALALDFTGGPGNYGDNFNNTSFTNSDGSTTWGPGWVETSDDNNPNGGQIRIDAGTNTMELRNGNSATIQRAVDLSGVASATLSFTYSEAGFGAGETVVVSFAADGQNFVTLPTLDQDSNNGSVSNLNLSGPFSANAAIRFEVSNVADTPNANDYIRIDNLSINYTKPLTVVTDISRVFTEGGSNVSIAPHPVITDDGTTLTSAKVILTNAQSGDDLVWGNGTTGNGFSIAKTNVAGVITVTLTSNTPQNFAAFSSRLDNIQYTNNSQNPDPQDRIIHVTVNDGLVDSNIATATIHVNQVNDPTIAGADRIVTNFINAEPFTVPDFALLANDSDPDNTLSISGIASQINLSATHASGSVSITDSGTTNGGSFSYNVADGVTNTAGVGNVTVVRDVTGAIDGANGNDILVGNSAASTLNGAGGNDIVFAGAGNDVINGGTGDDTNRAEAGDDTINWSATSTNVFGFQFDTSTDGHDIIDGGTEGGVGDTFVINGSASAETFRIYTHAAAVAANIVAASNTAEIIITRTAQTLLNGVQTNVIAELSEIEEIRINTTTITTTPTPGSANGDGVQVFGDFTGTSLNFSTITIDGNTGDDTVDISGLTSAHRIVFHSNGGHDTIVGTLRAQDVIDLAPGATRADYTTSEANGMTTMTNGAHSITFASSGTPQFAETAAAGPETGGPDENDGGVDDGSDDTTFVFQSAESANGAIISNFHRGDTIDLSAIDANTQASGKQSFVLFAGAGFTAAGQIIAHHEMGEDLEHTLLFGNTDDDDDAEFIIDLLGNHNLTGSDFQFLEDDDDDGDDDTAGNDDETTSPTAAGAVRAGTPQPDVLIGTAGDDNIVAFDGDDVATGDAGADTISAGAGADFVNGGDGRDVIFAGAGDDQVFGGGQADVIYGDAGADRIFGDGGNDLIDAGAGEDAVFGGAGNDLIVAEGGDGNDVYFGDDSDGGTGIDTIDVSAATVNVTANLGSGPLSNGTVSSSQTGNDTIWGIENINTGSGNDTITASNAVNVMNGGAGNDTFKFTSASAADGDTIASFEPGDRIDLTGIDANLGAAGDQSFTLVTGAAFTAAGQLAVSFETRAEGDFTVVQGNIGGNTDADFKVEIAGHHNLTNANVDL